MVQKNGLEKILLKEDFFLAFSEYCVKIFTCVL